ncbi:hypothetical protein [Allomuricauda sp. ARW1Y1]|jgi:hypothetical protein|uniref:hypothetical protein n=1 Tax=Allomuricauda sp. ARW1Y1 TaxID=2663843 RepID=UPI0015CDF80A|nr:hypothetical protein [Muricauda sp. ARW1Y1]NYJ26620.1 hypothetical protein [Muricauda sp. ARW1Y1]
MRTPLLASIMTILFITSCATTKTIKFTDKQPDVYTTDSLKDFLENTKKPKVVLRVPDASINTTSQENKDYLYNAIENQLLSSGFIVRDRQLFNQIIENESNNVDYEQLREKSDTDLIIELTKLDPSILYETNIFYDSNNRQRTQYHGSFKRYGASVEFKVVSIASNEYSGMYKFNYTPCVDGCIVAKSLKDVRKEQREMKKDGDKPYEGVEKQVLEEFIKDATKKLVEEMRY